MPAATRLEAGRVAARLARQVEVALAGVELSLSQYRILMLLDDGSAEASALADRLTVSRPSVTAVVDGLVARGLVERHQSRADRRRVGHVLTADGRRELAAADAAVEVRLAGLAARLGPAEEADAFRGLDCWQEALSAYRAARLAGER